MSRIRQWLSRALHGRRLAAIRRDSAAWHMLDADRYQAHADALRAGMATHPVGTQMRFAMMIGVIAMECRVEAAMARAGGDFDMAAEHEAEANWYAARHRQEVVMAGGRVCAGQVAA